jgi:integrase
MATFEIRKYVNKRTGKIRERVRAKIRLKGFAPDEATFDLMTDAKAWAAKREYELQYQQRFGVAAFKNKTVSDLLSRYGESLSASNPRRYKTSKPVIKIWDQRLGFVKLTDLTKDIVIRERDRLKQQHVKGDVRRNKLTNAAVNRHMSVLKRALNIAVKEWGWIGSSPLDGIKPLPEPKGRTRFLQGDELDRLLGATRVSENKDLLALTVLAITTGARRGELAAIRLKEINLEQRTILLPKSKNGKPRILRLEGYALELVKGLIDRAKTKQVFLFPSPHDIARANDFRTAWRTAIRRSVLEDFKFHDLRHTAASFYAMHGAGLHQIAEILGHSSLQVTQRYTHLLETQTAKVVENTATKVFGDDKSRLA